MTRSRNSSDRELTGVLGKHPLLRTYLKEWNAYFKESGLDASMEKYPATEKNLPERLSEMFHFDRRLYIVGISLQEAIIPLLDQLDQSAKASGKVSWVLNSGGVLVGYYSENLHPQELMEHLIEPENASVA